jgi:hypothetical protein
MRLLAAAVAVALVPTAAVAQLEEVVARTEDGVVRLSYATKADVEICDHGVRYHGRRITWKGRGEHEPPACRTGPVVVELHVRGGRVRGVELLVGNDAPRSRSAIDLGTVPPTEATRFLLSLPYGGASTDGAKDAILPAMLADVSDVWLDLLGIARDRDVPSDVRRSALFWLGQEAAAAATVGLSEVATDRDEEQDIRNAAIFALSQRPADEGAPMLMEIARTAEEAETRRQAMFWLAQSEAPGILDFFEEILLGQSR